MPIMKNIKTSLIFYSRLNHMFNIILIFLFILKPTLSISSIPTELVYQKTIQKQLVSLNFNTIDQRIFTLSYTTAMLFSPSPNQIYLAIAQMDYSANEYYSPSNKFGLYFEIIDPIANTTSVKLILDHQSSKMNSIKLSMLIFSSDYPNLNNLDKYFINYTQTSNVGLINLSSSNAIIVPFLYACNLKLTPHDDNFQFYHTMTISGLLINTLINYYGSYTNSDLRYQYMIIYQTTMSAFSRPRFDYYNISQIAGQYFVDTTLSTFNQGKSVYIFGLLSFWYIAVDNSSNPGLTFSSSILVNVLKLTFDDQFETIRYTALVINIYGCPDPTHPYMNRNLTSTFYQCYDSCPTGKYQNYNAIQNMYLCPVCVGYCLQCINSSRCQSCEPMYDLQENFTCVLKDSLYLYNGTIYACDNLIPNCSICDVNGTICRECQQGFVLNAMGACVDCQSIATNCQECNVSSCLACIAGYELITATLCQVISSPAPPLPLPSSICSSLLCQVCSSSNLSNCLQCKTDFKYVLISGICQLVQCGDNRIDSSFQACDDGNQLDYDGCSSNCLKVEQGFQCDSLHQNINSTLLKSDCYYTKQITFNPLSIKKVHKQNKLIIVFKNQNNKLKIWQSLSKTQLTQLISFQVNNQHEQLYNYTIQMRFVPANEVQQTILNKNKRNLLQSITLSPYNPLNYQYLIITLSYIKLNQYARSLNHQLSTLNISPQLMTIYSIFRSTTPSSSLTFILKTDDNSFIQYYDQTYYSLHLTIIETLSIMIVIICDFLIIASILSYLIQKSNSKQLLIAIENVIITQFTYYSFMKINEINPLFITIVEYLKYTSGYDAIMQKEQSNIQLNRQLLGIGIESVDFINNVNISLVIIIVVIVSGLCIWGVRYGVGKIKLTKDQVQRMIQYKENCKKQQFIDKQGKQDKTNKRGKQRVQQTKLQPNQKRYIKQHTKIQYFFIGNIAFTLFIFFLYKFVISSLIQFKYGINYITGMDIVMFGIFCIIFLMYIVLLLKKSIILSTFNQKIINNIRDKIQLSHKANNSQKQLLNKKQQQKYSLNQSSVNSNKPLSLKKAKQYKPLSKQQFQQQLNSNNTNHYVNIKFVYPILVISVIIVNSLSLIILGQLSYWNIAPILTHLILITCMLKYQFYDQVNKYRFYFNQIIGIFIQILLCIRNQITITSNQIPGKQQDQLGLFIPYTVISLLMIVNLNSVIFFVYSIKRIRCCDLQVEWENVKNVKNVKNGKNVKNDRNGQNNNKNIIKNNSHMPPSNIAHIQPHGYLSQSVKQKVQQQKLSDQITYDQKNVQQLIFRLGRQLMQDNNDKQYRENKYDGNDKSQYEDIQSHYKDNNYDDNRDNKYNDYDNLRKPNQRKLKYDQRIRQQRKNKNIKQSLSNIDTFVDDNNDIEHTFNNKNQNNQFFSQTQNKNLIKRQIKQSLSRVRLNNNNNNFNHASNVNINNFNNNINNDQLSSINNNSKPIKDASFYNSIHSNGEVNKINKINKLNKLNKTDQKHQYFFLKNDLLTSQFQSRKSIFSHANPMNYQYTNQKEYVLDEEFDKI